MNINVTLFGQAITFALLVIFTMKFVWPHLNKMIEDRADKIASGLAAAEKGQQALSEAKVKIADEMRQIQLRATEIISNSQKRADQMILDAKQMAEKEAQRILQDAKMQVEQEVLRAKEELKSKVSTLAVRGAEIILKSEINQERQAKLIESIKAEL